MSRYRAFGVLFIVFVVFVFAGGVVWTWSASQEKRAFLSDYIKADFEGREAVAEKYLKALPPEDLLDALEERDPLCHTDAHPLGRAVFRETQNLTRALAMCGTKCSYGCFHGMLYEMFSNSSDYLNGYFGGIIDEATTSNDVLQQIVASAPDFCSRPEVKQSIAPWACVHAIGHVIMYMSNYDPQKTISACEKFKDPKKNSVCAAGAFMEFMNDPAHRAVVTEKSYFPCDLFPQYAKSCFRYKSVRMIQAWGDTESAIKACRALHSYPSRLACIRGIGSWIGTPLERFSRTDGYADVCDLLDPDEQAACIEGAMSSVIVNMDADTDAVCDSMAPVFQSKCRDTFYEFRDLNMF